MRIAGAVMIAAAVGNLPILMILIGGWRMTLLAISLSIVVIVVSTLLTIGIILVTNQRSGTHD